MLRSRLFKTMFLSIQDPINQVQDYSGKSFSTLNQLIYFFYHDEFNYNMRMNFNFIEEFQDLKDFYQLNPNQIFK
ncbi:hypothetical protein M0811_13200 [Anaeramoeba ignava]|uniref:Uncharacterized protein n=1 Tax=Anaeramoeba ignava TaxID=1746090 RepID=A0A9Q0R5I5_ANAIG|nr:hypothetical protein M0811_13200 [Anaeramoeba ignava]